VGILIGQHAFNFLISNSRREVKHLLLILLTNIFCPEGGDFGDYFLENVKNPHPMPELPPPPPRLGLDIEVHNAAERNLVTDIQLFRERLSNKTVRDNAESYYG